MDDIDEQLLQLVAEALDLGFQSFADGDHNPFVMLLDADDNRHLTDLQTTSGVIDEALVGHGRKLIRGLKGWQLYALVADGYMITDDGKHYAVCVEAGKQGDKTAFLFALRYKRKGKSKRIVKDGRPAVVGPTKHLWKTATKPNKKEEKQMKAASSNHLAKKKATGKVLLHLNLHREFFCQILEGTKKIEYRGRTAYWKKRLVNRKYTHIRFRNGYRPVAPEMIVELKRIKDTGKEFELHLGQIVRKQNVRLLK